MVELKKLDFVEGNHTTIYSEINLEELGFTLCGFTDGLSRYRRKGDDKNVYVFCRHHEDFVFAEKNPISVRAEIKRYVP